MFFYRVMADLVVSLHAAFIAFVVFGQIAILIGALRNHRWVRNVWFRTIHLAAILYVVALAWLDKPCPLTTLELWLRQQAGQPQYSQRLEDIGFIAYWLHRMIFFEAEPWVFTLIYTLFGALVIATFILAPPRWRRA